METTNNKRGVVLDRRAREVITNVDKYFESEKNHAVAILHKLRRAKKPDGSIQMPQEVYISLMQYFKNSIKVTRRVHLATGVNKNTITRIRLENRDPDAIPAEIEKKEKVQKKRDCKKKIDSVNVCDNV